MVEGLRQSLQDAYLLSATSDLGQEARFSVQDFPSLPAAPILQSKTEEYGLPAAAMLMGALISASYLYITYRMDHTIRSSEDLAGIGVPVLSHVPQVSPYDNWPLHLRLKRRQRDFARRLAVAIALGPLNRKPSS